jgi:hypothetical protein
MSNVYLPHGVIEREVNFVTSDLFYVFIVCLFSVSLPVSW